MGCGMAHCAVSGHTGEPSPAAHDGNCQLSPQCTTTQNMADNHVSILRPTRLPTLISAAERPQGTAAEQAQLAEPQVNQQASPALGQSQPPLMGGPQPPSAPCATATCQQAELEKPQPLALLGSRPRQLQGGAQTGVAAATPPTCSSSWQPAVATVLNTVPAAVYSTRTSHPFMQPIPGGPGPQQQASLRVPAACCCSISPKPPWCIACLAVDRNAFICCLMSGPRGPIASSDTTAGQHLLPAASKGHCTGWQAPTTRHCRPRRSPMRQRLTHILGNPRPVQHSHATTTFPLLLPPPPGCPHHPHDAGQPLLSTPVTPGWVCLLVTPLTC